VRFIAAQAAGVLIPVATLTRVDANNSNGAAPSDGALQPSGHFGPTPCPGSTSPTSEGAR
jgi:hypothetical protein